MIAKTKSKFKRFMGRLKTKAEAEKKARDRKRYGYDHKIVKDDVRFEGRLYRGWKVMETQRPVRHTWWNEHMMGESTKHYIDRMKKKGIKAYVK